MDLVVYEWPEHWDCVYVIPISDTHIGDPRFDPELLQGYVDWVAERENAFVVLNGDIVDAAVKRSVGDVYEAEMTTDDALRYARDVFAPISDQIIGATEGNHERRITKETSISPMRYLADFLDTPFYPDGIFFKFRFGRGGNGKPVHYTAYFTHGYGGGRTFGNKAKKLRSLKNIVLADIYSMGHHHVAMLFQDTYYVPDVRNNCVTEKRRTYVSSGAFLGWGGYAERQGYEPNRLGSPRIRLDGEKRDVHVSI